MGADRNKAGAEAALLALAMAGARAALVNPTKHDRPRIWLCLGCGNKLGRGDTCRFHGLPIRARARMVFMHLVPAEPGCSCCFCAEVDERARRTGDEWEAIVDTCFLFATGEKF